MLTNSGRDNYVLYSYVHKTTSQGLAGTAQKRFMSKIFTLFKLDKLIKSFLHDNHSLSKTIQI